MQALISHLRDVLGAGGVLVAKEIGERYFVDSSGVNACKPAVVLRPSNTEQVSQILKYCHANKHSIVVQGGRTGLAGGATPKAGEVVISLERMNVVEEVDTASMTMTAMAGATLQTLQEQAEAAGLFLPLDLGARGSCTIGGNVATNAGGNQAVRYGVTRDLVLSVEAVLADGSIIGSLNKMIKDNAGYNLNHLFIGTEGTLGVITRVVMRLYPQPVSSCTALCAVADFKAAVELLNSSMKLLPGGATSFEVMWQSYLDYIDSHIDNLNAPFAKKYPLYVLVQCNGNNEENDKIQFEQLLSTAIDDGIIQDAIIAQSIKDARALWDIRDGIGEVLPKLHDAVTFDISVAVSNIDEMMQRVRSTLNDQFADITLLEFGHIGDSNVHILANTGCRDDKPAIEESVYRILADYKGSISAEHGIGVLKKPYLHYSKSADEIRVMRDLKSTMDANNILNPGRVF